MLMTLEGNYFYHRGLPALPCPLACFQAYQANSVFCVHSLMESRTGPSPVTGVALTKTSAWFFPKSGRSLASIETTVLAKVLEWRC